MPEDEDDHDIDILSRPRARQGLLLLRLAEKKGEAYISAGEFETRMPLTSRHARKLRRYLVHWNLVTEEEGAQNRQLFIRLRLTDKGRKVADLLLAARKEAHGEKALKESSREKY